MSVGVKNPNICHPKFKWGMVVVEDYTNSPGSHRHRSVCGVWEFGDRQWLCELGRGPSELWWAIKGGRWGGVQAGICRPWRNFLCNLVVRRDAADFCR